MTICTQLSRSEGATCGHGHACRQAGIRSSSGRIGDEADDCQQSALSDGHRLAAPAALHLGPRVVGRQHPREDVEACLHGPHSLADPHAWTAQEVGRIWSEKLLEVLWAQEDVIREGALHVLHKSRAIVVSAGLEDDFRELVPIPDATGVCLGFLAVILGLLPSPVTFAAAFLALAFAAAPVAGLAPAALVGVGPGGVGHAAKRD